MQFLNKEIEALTKRKKSQSLIKKQISCGIFQDLETMGVDKSASATTTRSENLNNSK